MAMEELTIDRILELIKLSRLSPAHRDTIFINKPKIIELIEAEMQSQRDIKEISPEYYDKDYFSSLRDALFIVNQISSKSETPQPKINTKPIELAKKANEAIAKEIKKEASKPKKQKTKTNNTKNTTNNAILSQEKEEKQQKQEKQIQPIIVSEEKTEKQIQPVVVSEEKQKKVQKVSSERHRRTADQIHEEKMERLAIQRLHQENIRNNLIETERHHRESERIDELKLLKADREYLTRQLENTGKTTRAEVLSKSKNYIAGQHTKRFVKNLDFLQTEAGQKLTLDKTKTSRSIESQRTKRETIKRQRAELALEKAKLSNIIKEKQIEDRKRRDLERQKRKNQEEIKRNRQKINESIYGALKDGSPALAYAFKFGSMLGRNNSSNNSSVSDSGIGSFLGTGAAIASGKVLGRFGGMAKGIGGFAGKGIGKIKGMISPTTSKISNRLASSSISAKANIMSKVPKGLGGVASKLPIIGSLIAAGLDFSENKSMTSAVSVGAGALAGAKIGAIAGSLLGPPGMIIGGLIGGYLGAGGAKILHDKVMRWFGFDDESDKSNKNGSVDKISGGGALPQYYDGSFKKHTVPSYMADSSTKSGSGGSYSTLSKPTITGNLSNKHQYAMDYFMKKGWTRDEAAAIVGNLSVESGGFSEDVISGKIRGDRGSAIGIAQWRGDRVKNFKKFKGKDLVGSSLDDQLDYVHYELTEGSDIGARQAGTMIKGKDASTGSGIFDQFYERSSGEHRQKRIKISKELAQTQTTQNLIDANRQLSNKEKQTKSSPTNVNIVGGSSGGSNISNTTIINAPDTDPSIRIMSYQHLHISRL